jgi:CHASE3 domain sensor protein
MPNEDIRAFSVDWNDENSIRKLRIILDERGKEIREERVMDAYKQKHPRAISARIQADLQKQPTSEEMLAS